MPRRLTRSGSRNRVRSVAPLGILVAILAIYFGYWFSTPSNVEVSSISASVAAFDTMQVSLHNPTFKVVTGSIHRIEALVDVPTGHGGTTVLQSVPGDYPFTLLPQSSLQLNVPMIFRVLPGFDYDITLRIDGVGEKILTITMPKS